jgi:mevalonate kinase
MINLVYQKKANGKLLLTSEYFVLDGAEALALPTVYGQNMIVKNADQFFWKAFNNKHELWLDDKVQNGRFESQILNQIFELISVDNKIQDAFQFETYLDFPNEWGLGTSSTFIALLADFYSVNPYKLNKEIFKGSGYDIACAFAQNPIHYSKLYDEYPMIKSVEISNKIKPFLYFLYLGQKQNSRAAISHYHQLGLEKNSIVIELNQITDSLIHSHSYKDWISILTDHESIISNNLHLEKVSETFLKGLPYFSKSLGAWGGDFAMIITDDDYESIVQNVKNLGLDTIFKYNELILQ